MVSAYKEVKHLDSASGGMLATPRATRGFHAAAFFSDPAKHSLRDFMAKFEQPNFFLSTDLDAQASLLNWLTLHWVVSTLSATHGLLNGSWSVVMRDHHFSVDLKRRVSI